MLIETYCPLGRKLNYSKSPVTFLYQYQNFGSHTLFAHLGLVTHILCEATASANTIMSTRLSMPHLMDIVALGTIEKALVHPICKQLRCPKEKKLEEKTADRPKDVIW